MNCKQPMCTACTRHPRDGHYRILLLTCWLEADGDGHNPEAWRFRLEEPRSGVRRGCVGVQRLVALLSNEIADDVVLTVCETDSTN